MASMITPDDIADLYGRALTSAEESEVEMYIDFAIGEIEAYLGRPVTLTEFTDETVVPDAKGTCYFKNTPVVSVEEMTINGRSIADPAEFLTLTSYGLEDIWECVLRYPGVQVDELDRIGVYGAEVTVSYTAGLDFPNAVRSLVAGGVLRKFREEVGHRTRDDRGHVGVKKIQVEDYAVEYERPLASSRSSGTSAILIFQSDTDFWSIRRYKRRTVT